MDANDFARADELLLDPDAEDCERFASRYGRWLLNTARAHQTLLVAAQGLGVIGGGYCFCSTARDPDKAAHQPECAALVAAIAKA